MKCLICATFSFKPICEHCLSSLTPTPSSRTLECGLKVYSFYHYSEVECLLRYKYEVVGSKIFAALARKCAEYFYTHDALREPVLAVGLDDEPRGYYSHTAVIVREFIKKSKNLFPDYNALVATNHVSYAGKSLEFRKSNPRNFIYQAKSGAITDAILFDDVITTGLSLQEACACLQKSGINSLFALTLANAQL